MEQITLNATADGTPRTETLMGREYAVFPAVLVRSQVLNNNLGATFLPADEIEASVDAWNGIPVVIRHPATSARDPEVLNQCGVGFLFRARYEDAALKADVFLDVARADAVPDAGDIVANVQNGEVGELSTGFGTQIEAMQGLHEGARYDVIMRGIKPDHLALLVGERGACSVDDGCGLGKNAASKTLGERVMAFLTERLGLFPGAANQSDEDLRDLLASALRERFGGPDKWIWPVAVFSDEGLVVFEQEGRGGEDGLFRVSFEVSDGNAVTLGDPMEVRRVTTFEPVANTGESTQEDGLMQRDEMIAQLAEAGPLDEDALKALNDCQLKALLAVGEGEEDEEQPKPAAADEVAELREKVARLEAAAAPAIAEAERERTELIAALVANERCAFGEDELHPMSTTALQKLAQACQVRHYGGRGGPRVTENAVNEAYAPVRPYWQKEG